MKLTNGKLLGLAKNKLILTCISALLVLIASGCFTGNARSTRQEASVVQFLYPAGQKRPIQPHIPALHLPLKVGIAFVPQGECKQNYYYSHNSGLTAAEQRNLLQQVADKFRGYKFVDQIEVIPSSYLRPEGSFNNLEQLRSMFGVDVIALVSYDQVQFHDQDAASLAYWTLVGAYLVPAEKFDTHTMLDTAVYDIPSRTLLFRAPGTSRVKSRGTDINASEEQRKDAAKGFEIASTNLVTNLQAELALFQQKVQSRTNDFKIVAKPGYTGGGAFGVTEAGLLACIGLFILLAKGKRKPELETNCARSN